MSWSALRPSLWPREAQRDGHGPFHFPQRLQALRQHGSVLQAPIHRPPNNQLNTQTHHSAGPLLLISPAPATKPERWEDH